MPTSKRADLSKVLPAVRCTARKQNGEPCKAMAARGANVCRVHGGSAPQVKAAAQRRIQNALDAAAKRLLGFAFDDDVAESIALQAVNGILDRGGLSAKQAVEVDVKPPAPWEEVLGDVVHTTKAQYEAMKRGEMLPPTRQPALPAPADDIVDAEVVDAPVSQAECVGGGADVPPVPEWAEPPPAPPSRELVTLEDAAAEVAQANRRAGVSQRGQKRS